METAVDPYDMSNFLKGMTMPMDFFKALRGDLVEPSHLKEDVNLQGTLSGFTRLPETLQQEIFEYAWSSWASPAAEWEMFSTKGLTKTLDLLPLSRQLYPLLRPLYWRNLELKIAPTFPIEQIGKLLEAQPNIRDLIQVISLEDVSRVPDYEGFQHDLGKIFRLCNCKALSYKWLGEVRIVNTYLQSGGRLVSLRIQLEGTEFPWGGTTGPAFDYWCELLCAVLPQLESLHLSNLELSAASSGEILGSIGGIEDAIVQFPECHRLKELEFGWHHGSCPLPLLKHILKSASRSLQRVSFVESALGIDQLQTAFDANNLSALKSLELKLRGKEPATIVALLQQVSVACPLLQHAFIVTTIHVRCRLVHDSSRLLEAIFLAPSHGGQCDLQSPKIGSDWRSNPVTNPVVPPVLSPAVTPVNR